MKIEYLSDGMLVVPETQMEKDHMLLCVKGISSARIVDDGTIRIRYTMAYEQGEQ